jgi:hypothetical protein
VQIGAGATVDDFAGAIREPPLRGAVSNQVMRHFALSLPLASLFATGPAELPVLGDGPHISEWATQFRLF